MDATKEEAKRRRREAKTARQVKAAMLRLESGDPPRALSLMDFMILDGARQGVDDCSTIRRVQGLYWTRRELAGFRKALLHHEAICLGGLRKMALFLEHHGGKMEDWSLVRIQSMKAELKATTEAWLSKLDAYEDAL